MYDDELIIAYMVNIGCRICPGFQLLVISAKLTVSYLFNLTYTKAHSFLEACACHLQIFNRGRPAYDVEKEKNVFSHQILVFWIEGISFVICKLTSRH